MGNFFNVDNGFFTFMGKFWDMMLVSIMWTICTIPTFLAFVGLKDMGILFLLVAALASVLLGPASTALYYAVIKSIRRDRGYVTREFFRSFKSNFKVGAITAYIYFVVVFILYVDFNYANTVLKQGGIIKVILVSFFVAVAIVAAFMIVWSFPILSRFTLGAKRLFKMSFIFAVRHFLTSIAILILLVLSVVGILYCQIAIIVVPGLFCFICSFLYERVFKKYMPKPEGTPEETGEDQWYWE